MKSRMLSLLTAFSLMSASAASAQQASYTLYGPICHPNVKIAPVPLIMVSPPKLGGTLVVRTSPSFQGRFGSLVINLFTTGTSRTRWGSLSLPFDLRPISTPSWRFYCSLLASPDIAWPLPFTNGGLVDLSFPIPNNKSLLGMRFYQQAHEYVRAFVGEDEWFSSQGGEAVIGN